MELGWMTDVDPRVVGWSLRVGHRDDQRDRHTSKGRRGLLASLLLLAMAGVALPGELAGRAGIIDGDTLEIHGLRVRLWGIDAPESSQLCRGDDSKPYRCGAKAAHDLDAFIAERPIECTPLSQDQYGRT